MERCFNNSSFTFTTIQTYYDTKDIGEFPERLKPKSIKSDIDLKNEFPSLAKVNTMIAGLHLAIYSPMLYILPNRLRHYEELYDQQVKDGKGSFKQVDREKNIVNLMRVNIFKRLESSVNSFTLTLQRILHQIDTMLSLIESGQEYNFDDSSIDEDEFDDVEVGGKIKVKVSDLDKLRLKQDLLEDKETLDYLLEYSKKVDMTQDAKLHDLKNHITDKIQHPINSNNKKIIIFTSFSDTAKYLYENICDWLLQEHGLYSAVVTGGSGTKTNLKSVSNLL